MPGYPFADPARPNRSRTLLLATDISQSVLAESAPGQRLSYSPYGVQHSRQPAQSRLGFNGELQGGPQGWYHLGNGHRVYNPVLGRFHSADALSPFSDGGLNAYTYCLGDPVNRTDPTGQASGWVHGLSLALLGLTLISGTASLFGPLLLSKATGVAALAKSSSALAVPIATGKVKSLGLAELLAARSTGLIGTPLGGVELGVTAGGLVGVPIGAYGVFRDMTEQPVPEAEALMFVGALIAGLGLSSRLAISGIPKVLTSKGGDRFARIVHGKQKVLEARQSAFAPLRALKQARRDYGIDQTPYMIRPRAVIQKPEPRVRTVLPNDYRLVIETFV